MKYNRIVLLVLIFMSLTACDTDQLHIIPFKRYIVPQGGMYPNIPAKTTLWVKRKPLFKCNRITRGEIIVFYQKKDNKIYDFIWRVIGLPGDQVRIEGDSVYINGQLLEHEKIKETTDQILFLEKGPTSQYMVAYDKNPKPTQRVDIDLIVPDKHFFLLGDNRDNAMDSRFNGFVDYKNVIGIKM